MGKRSRVISQPFDTEGEDVILSHDPRPYLFAKASGHRPGAGKALPQSLLKLFAACSTFLA